MGVLVGMGANKVASKKRNDDKSKAKITELENKIKVLEESEAKFKESQIELVKENEGLKAKIAELEKISNK